MAGETNVAKISEEQWKLVRDVAGGLNKSRLLVRSVSNVQTADIKNIVDDLRLRTSTKNPANVEKAFVDSPMASVTPYDDVRVFPGRWRHVSTQGTSRGENSGTVVQTLAEGFVQTYAQLGDPILVGASDRLLAPHARLSDADKAIVEIKYRAIDPSKAEAIQRAIVLNSVFSGFGDHDSSGANETTVQTKIVILEDGSANIHVLSDKNVWVTATNASATEDVVIRDFTADASTPTVSIVKAWNNITQASVNTILLDPIADWVTHTAYVVDDVRLNGSSVYVCITAHTSEIFGVDLAAGKWQLYGRVKIQGTDNIDGSGRVVLRIDKLLTVLDEGDLPEPQIDRQQKLMRPFGLTDEVKTSKSDWVRGTFRNINADSIVRCLGYQLLYDTKTVAFAVGRILTGGTSGATGVIVEYDRYWSLDYDAQATNFTVGETVGGATSGATGVVISDADSGTTGTLVLGKVVGTFSNDELLHGSTGGTDMAVANGAATDSNTGLFILDEVNGTFSNNEVITAAGGGTAAADGASARVITDAELFTILDLEGGTMTMSDRLFQVSEDGTGVFTVIAQSVDWDNWNTTTTKPASIIESGRMNLNGYGQGKIKLAPGVPIDLATTALDNLTADTDYSMSDVSFSEGQNGEASFRLTQRRTFDYDSSSAAAWVTATKYDYGDYVTNAGTAYTCIEGHTSGTFATDLTAGKWIIEKAGAPREIMQIFNVGKQPAGRTFAFYRVAQDRIATVKAAAATASNYTDATWFSYSNYVISRVQINRHPDGAADIIIYAEDSTTNGTGATCVLLTASEIVYTYQHYRDQRGTIIRSDKIGRQERQMVTWADCEDYITTHAKYDKALPPPQTESRKSGTGCYQARIIWIEEEDVTWPIP